LTVPDGLLTFSLKPTAPFRLDLAAWTLRRRPENIIDRWDGQSYRRVLSMENGPAEVEARQVGPLDSPRLRIVVTGAEATLETTTAVTSALERLLGLAVDLSEFEQFAAHDERLGPLSDRFRGMKPPRFPTVFECVVNAIACQQVTLTLGIRLIGRLAETYGQVINSYGVSAHAFPRPEALATARPEEIRSLGFSFQKARALIELSTAVVGGRLDLESLASETDEAAVQRLCALRGVGRWTAEYVLLRGLGRTHVFPGDDVGARNNLVRWLALDEPLNYGGVRRAIRPWDPYGGLIYFHLLLDSLAGAGRIP
jgi:DNA-3-methyladenine glycosylase II